MVISLRQPEVVNTQRSTKKSAAQKVRKKLDEKYLESGDRILLHCLKEYQFCWFFLNLSLSQSADMPGDRLLRALV